MVMGSRASATRASRRIGGVLYDGAKCEFVILFSDDHLVFWAVCILHDVARWATTPGVHGKAASGRLWLWVCDGKMSKCQERSRTPAPTASDGALTDGARVGS